MKNRARAVLAIVGAASALAFSGPTLAQDTGFYVGLSLGQSAAKNSCDEIAGPGISCDDKDTAWKILGGYQFNRNLAFEFGYTDLGEVSASGPGGSASVESSAFELVALGILPLADKFSVYGKVGLYRGETDATAPGISLSESNTDLTFGIGVRYDITRNLGIRGEWQKYQDVGGGEIGEDDVDVISVGIIWRF